MRGGRGTGVRRDDVDNRAAVRGDDGINDALDDLRLRDDDDDDENAFAIAIATTDDDVRRRGKDDGHCARRNAIVVVADIDIDIDVVDGRGGSSYSPAPRSLGGGRRERIDVVVPPGRRRCRHRSSRALPSPSSRGRPGVRQQRW